LPHHPAQAARLFRRYYHNRSRCRPHPACKPLRTLQRSWVATARDLLAGSRCERKGAGEGGRGRGLGSGAGGMCGQRGYGLYEYFRHPSLPRPLPALLSPQPHPRPHRRPHSDCPHLIFFDGGRICGARELRAIEEGQERKHSVRIPINNI
jgi:hypothetical protein